MEAFTTAFGYVFGTACGGIAAIYLAGLLGIFD